MDNGWILDVLADLRTFARRNGLPALAGQLDDTLLLATAEITSTRQGKPGHERGPAKATGTDPDLFGRGA